MGTLVGLYLIFQHYNNDFLNLTESTGGGVLRVTGFMGNAIFAAAVLTMTVPATLVAAAVSIHDENWLDWGPLPKIGQLVKSYVLTSTWALVLAIQLLGLMFTFSRGPWVGAVLGLATFLGLILLFVGWRSLIRTGLVLTLAGVLAVSFLHWQGSIAFINIGSWFGVALALSGLDFLMLPDDVLIFRRRAQSVLDQALEQEFSSQ